MVPWTHLREPMWRMLTELTSEFTILTWEFIYVIWNSWLFFGSHLSLPLVGQLLAVPGIQLFVEIMLTAAKPPFSTLLERQLLAHAQARQQAHGFSLRCGLFGIFGEVDQLCT